MILFALAIVIACVVFAMYLELSPGLGNIWYRHGRFSPVGYIKCIVYPLQERQLWHYKHADLNIFYLILLTYACLKYIF